MKKTHLFASVLAILVVIVLIAVVVSRETAKDTRLKIGIITDLTSSAAGVYGIPLKRGVDLAFSQLDPEHKRYSVEYQDYQLDTKKALPAYEALKLDGTHIFIVDGSPALAVISPEAKKDGNLIMNPSSFIPSYKDDNPLTCRVAVTTDTYGPAYANFIVKVLHKKNIALLIPNYEPGVALRDSITSNLEKIGGHVVQSEMYLKDDSDFRTQVLKIKVNKNVEAVVVVNYFKSVNTMFSQLSNLGVSVPIVTDDWTINNQALVSKKLVDRAYYVGYMFSGNNPETNDQNLFYADFKSAYGVDPGLESVLGFDIVHILNEVVSSAGATSPSDIASYITEIHPSYQALSGKLTFNKDCEVQREVTFKQVEGEKSVPVSDGVGELK